MTRATTTAPSAATARGAAPGFTTAVGSVAVFFIALELTIISVAVPAIADEFASSTRATLSWIFTAYNIGVASLLLIGGWLAERFGRKRLFLFGLGLFTVASLACGLANSQETLIGARAVQGRARTCERHRGLRSAKGEIPLAAARHGVFNGMTESLSARST